MGYALARSAFRRGAEVLLVSGPTALPCPPGVTRLNVQTAREMYETVIGNAGLCSVIVKAAAVADYRPETQHEHKVKKESIDVNLVLESNPDILLELGRRKKTGQILVGFAAESKNLVDEGKKKLKKKNLDLIAVNDIGSENTGFEVESNQLLLISSTGTEKLPHTSKSHTADLLWERITSLLPKQPRRDG
jgi:phosphopantothenoylcysteine decarboxylase/phosphopantothenate--cysteine ligase